jgi:uncharacterized RDD family membrane protein YckC
MQNIIIKTTQNVAIEYELASLRERITAFMIDLLVVLLGYMLLVILIVNAASSKQSINDMAIYVVYSILPIACFLLYQLISEIALDGQSWGKRATHIKVIRLDGEEVSLSDYLIRAVFYLIDVFLCLGTLGVLSISASSKNQRLGDLAANTTVIRLRSNIHFELKDILKIDSMDSYKVTYPQVKQLSEQDMLLIKNVLNRHQQFRNVAHEEALLELTTRLQQLLHIPKIPSGKLEFLTTLLRDYIVLTR